MLVKVVVDLQVLRRPVSSSSFSSRASGGSDGIVFASQPKDNGEVSKRATTTKSLISDATTF
jgi:hypothetical protein